MGEVLAPLAKTILCTQSHHPRACDAQRLADELTGLGPTPIVVRDPVDAYTYAVNTAEPDDVILVTGSLFLISQIRAALRSAQDARERSRLRRARVTEQV